MDPAERFATVVGADDDVRLDVAAFCIAAHAHPGLDIDAGCARLDDLAREALASTLDEMGPFDRVLHLLFRHHGFLGDTQTYGDPENSFLDSVIARKRGIPITLSVLVIEVARRVGFDVHGIGMPGHFLVQEAGADGVWIDPFGGGTRLSYADCARRVDDIYGGARRLEPDDLAPTPPRAILARMLANLEHGPLASDPTQLAWMLRLHVAIPRLPVGERVRLLRQYALVGDPAHVARAYEFARAEAGAEAGAEVEAQLAAEAGRYRTRWN